MSRDLLVWNPRTGEISPARDDRPKRFPLIAGDSYGDLWTQSTVTAGQTDLSKVSAITAIRRQLPMEELWAGGTRHAKGRFVCFLAPKEAFRNNWKFVTPDGRDDAPPRLRKRLLQIQKDFQLKRVHPNAVGVCRALGRALVCLIPKSLNNYEDVEFRVLPVYDTTIYYDQATGEILYYQPWVWYGQRRVQLKVPVEQAVLYVNGDDPFGNREDGISELFSIYNPMKYWANILESWAKTINQRGLGLLTIKLPDKDFEEIETWKSNYGNPAMYSVLFHNEEMEIKTHQGISGSFDITTVQAVYTKEQSSGTGIGEARINGVQQGRVTGSETDQDNYASIQSAIQEQFNANLVRLYEIVDESVTGRFDISYEFDIKLDRRKEAEIQTMIRSNVGLVADILTVNQVLAEIGKPPWDDPRGDTIYSEWKQQMLPQDEGDLEEEEKEEEEEEEPEEPERDSRKKRLTPSEKKKYALLLLRAARDAHERVSIRDLTSLFEISNTDATALRKLVEGR